MNRRFFRRRGPGRARLLRMALPLALTLPLTSWARVNMTIDGGGGQAGDPLDTNDCGGGSVGDGHQPDPNVPVYPYSAVRSVAIDGRRLLLIPVNEGGLLTFRLVIIDERAAPEKSDAR